MSALTHEDLIWAQLECDRSAIENQHWVEAAAKRGDAEMAEFWQAQVRKDQVRSARFRDAADALLDAIAPRKERAHG